MSDETVHTALRRNAPLVLIEAPAGCGKTHQAADYAHEAVTSGRIRRPLILTHTHAACSVFAERTGGAGDVRTIDSLIGRVAGVYHQGLGLPQDVGAWVREDSGKRYTLLARKVSALLQRHPMIAASLVNRHRVVICDEHQDATAEQHAIVMELLNQGAHVRIFADPMQAIFKGRADTGSTHDWQALVERADEFEKLDFPHRWKLGCKDLGQWTLAARDTLKKTGGRIDLRGTLPPSITLLFAENQAQKAREYRLASSDQKAIDAFVRNNESVLVLTRHNDTARSLHAFFYRGVPLWEGHVRNGLERLVSAMRTANADPDFVASAFVDFMGTIGVGFTPSAYGNRFRHEVRKRCAKATRGKPALIQELARFIVDDPSHRSVAKALRRIHDWRTKGDAFGDVHFDHHHELWDAIRLGDFPAVDAGLSELSHRRTFSRPKPPPKAISTIHKAKGLECGAVVVMPCDASTFPDREISRALLYVALSRAKDRLMLVLSRANPSPLFVTSYA